MTGVVKLKYTLSSKDITTLLLGNVLSTTSTKHRSRQNDGINYFDGSILIPNISRLDKICTICK